MESRLDSANRCQRAVRTRTRISGRLFGLTLLVASALATGANPPPPVYDPMKSAPPSAVPAAPQAAAASPMDVPLRLLAEARQSIQGVRDYSCLFVKHERIGRELQPENLIDMKVRNQPFSVYMRWLGPQSMLGQEACYVAGRNNGMLRVHSTGVLRVAGFISVETTDARVMASNRHPVTEAGIAHLIERYNQRWEMERRVNKTVVRVGEFEYNRRRCIRVETLHPDNSSGQMYSYRNLVYFDKENHLPIRVENYEWPRPGGPPEGELMESYSYVNLRLNPGLGEEVFNH